jgi:hypothetical protein
MRFAAFFRDLITLKFSNAFSRIKAIAGVFINMKLVIKKRRFVQAKRKVSDKFLFKVFSEKYILKR